MRKKRPELATSALIYLAIVTVPVWAQEDMPGSQDHPNIPRIEGTWIVGFDQNPFDEGEFIVGIEDRELSTNFVEGKRTRIIYLGPKSVSSLRALRNYQTALEDLGTVEEVFACRKYDCPSNLPDAFMWAQQRRVPNEQLGGSLIYYPASNYHDQSYWYATVTGDNSRYHVSLYSSVFAEGRPHQGLPAIHLEILEESEFEATLEVVAPEEIAESIGEKGHIALYGINFDLDSAELKSDSKPALAAVATAMRNDPALSIYVVGHTDNQGTYEYNLDLSKRRAGSVVEVLTGEHSIAAERLRALGVGPAAPVASNKTEDGKALNRRVELVEF